MIDKHDECKLSDQLLFIKDILVLDLFHAGANWQNEFLQAQDDKGKVLPQKMDVLNAKRDGIIEAYTSVFNVLYESESYDNEPESNDDVEDLLHKNLEN